MSDYKINKKTALRILIFLMVVFCSLFIFYINENSSLQEHSLDLENNSLIDFQSVDIVPYKVKVGDKQTTTVKIKSTEEVEKVFAQIPFEGSYDEVSLRLISGDGFDGIWQCEWIAHNTLTKEYITTITAITKNSHQEKTTSTWWDDTETAWLQGWQDRKKITVTETSGSTLTDYQVPIDMTTALYDNTSLAASWHFSEGTGSYVKDSSVNNNIGTIIGATWATDIHGDSSLALGFNGSSDYVTITDDDTLEPSGDATIAFWVYPTDWTQDATAISFLCKRSATADGYVVFYYRTSSSINFDWGGSAYRWDTGFNPPLNEWSYVVLTRNSSGRELFVNGESYASTDSAGSSAGIPTASDLIIGKNTVTAAYYFKGSMDEIQIYDRVLSDNEISQLYGEGKGRIDMNDLRFTSADGITDLSYWLENDSKVWVKIPTLSASSDTNIYYYFGNTGASGVSSVTSTFIREISGLVGGWNFSEGSGTTARDSSGNGNNGTISGATWASDRYGNSNSALSFDGSDDYVDYGNDSSLDITDEISISVWMNYSSVGSGCLLAKGNPLNYYFGTANTGTTVRFREGAINYNATANHGYSTGEWHNLILTLDQSGGAIKFYSDGSQLGDTVTISNSLSSDDTTMRSGIIDSFLDKFNGILDDIYFYNGILGSSEVSDIYNNAIYSTPDYPNKSLVYKYIYSEPTYSISSQEESRPNRSGTTGVSGGGPLMF